MFKPYYRDHNQNQFVQRHRDSIAGVIGCFDRIIIRGTLSSVGYDRAMESHLHSEGIMLKDYSQWASSRRDEVRGNAQRVAGEAGIEIEHVRSSKSFRKEARIKAIVAERGTAPGLVHVFSAMEPCNSFRWHHDRASGVTRLKPVPGRCLHYYFYFIDEAFGLAYVRVPTWAPFALQVYINGHQRLARQMDKAGIGYELADNAFVHIGDFDRAQKLSDGFRAEQLEQRLRRWAKRFCPPAADLPGAYYWTIQQAEYATDVIFRRQVDFRPLYDNIVRTAVHSVRAEQVATFPGRKLNGNYRGEAGNDFSTRIEGTRIRHQMGAASIKMYDKMALMMRIECTTYDVIFFSLHRTVEKRDGTSATKLAPLRKSIYSLRDLGCLMSAATGRYLSFMADIDDPGAGLKALRRFSNTARDVSRNWRGFNLLDDEDHQLFVTLARGEWSISGFRNADLRRCMPQLSRWRRSYLLKRLRVHGIIKKVARRNKYYLTRMGSRAVAAALTVRQEQMLPIMCHG